MRWVVRNKGNVDITSTTTTTTQKKEKKTRARTVCRLVTGNEIVVDLDRLGGLVEVVVGVCHVDHDVDLIRVAVERRLVLGQRFAVLVALSEAHSAVVQNVHLQGKGRVDILILCRW